MSGAIAERCSGDLMERSGVLPRLEETFGFRLDKSDPPYYEQIEARSHPFLPTIGIEIEVTWSSVFPDYAQHWFAGGQKYSDFDDQKRAAFDNLADNLDRQIKPLFEKTVACGIPAGKDSYWEFAFLPARHYETLAREVRLLEQIGFINPDCRLPLHLTLGKVRANRSSYVLASLLEISNGCSPDRILAAVNNGQSLAWGRHIAGSLKERQHYELRWGVPVGVEIRSLEAHGAKQVETILHQAFWISAGIIAAQAHSRPGANESLRRYLAEKWHELERSYFALLSGIEGIDVSYRWPHPKDDGRPWHDLARLLGGELEGSSEALELVRRLVTASADDMAQAILSTCRMW